MTLVRIGSIRRWEGAAVAALSDWVTERELVLARLGSLCTYPGACAAAFLFIAFVLLAASSSRDLLVYSMRRTLPFERPGDLFLVSARTRNQKVLGLAPAIALRFRDLETLERIGAYRFETSYLVYCGGTAKRETYRSTQLIFGTEPVLSLLGVTPLAGRELHQGDFEPEARRVALLTDHAYRDKFASRPSAIGQKVVIGGQQITIVGVLPRSFQVFAPTADFYLPLIPLDGTAPVHVIARRKPGVHPSKIFREIEAITAPQGPTKLTSWTVESLKDRLLINLAIPAFLSGLLGVVLCVLMIRDAVRNWLAPFRTAWARLPLRQWMLLVANAAAMALFLTAFFGCIEQLVSHIRPVPIAPSWFQQMLLTAVMLTGYVLLYGYITRWCIRDSQLRCRTCLRPLRMPLASGRRGALLLEPFETEYVCFFGHGRLIVSAGLPATHLPERWSPARELWQQLREVSP
jgi:hypothetical protein